MECSQKFESIETLPSLPPIMHPLSEGLISQHPALITELMHGLGPTLHVVLPQVFDDTVKQFQKTLTMAGVDGFILFAKKANKARCFIKRCPDLGIGVDAASLQETEQALGCGVPGQHIGITGPAKHDDLLQLALRQQCLVAIDGLDELVRFAALADRSRARARILLRRRTQTANQPSSSRFGMSHNECEEALRFCMERRHDLTLEGFSFHLSGYSPQTRAENANQMIDACIDARERGLKHCHSINIGGGFAVRYVEQAHWDAFQQSHQSSHYHAGRTFPDFYPYYSASHGAAMLAEILEFVPDGAHTSIAQRLRQNGLRLLLEPGRALLDQAGLTAFQVQGVKDRAASEGYGILTVGGTSFSVSEQWFNSEYLPDPLLLQGYPPDGGYAACVGGASCLDSDMVTWRKVRFPRRPRIGDVLLYLNTAGYQMDSNESPFHDLPLPPKVVVTVEQGTPRWQLDSGGGRIIAA